MTKTIINNILFVCIGNICRSPMAEALFKAANNKQRRNIHASSAGLQAMVNHSADATSQELMKKKGLDISHHQARQITSDLIVKSDLILTMSNDQKRTIETKYTHAHGKIFRLGEYDVADPYKRMPIIFEQALLQIEEGLHHWYKMLFAS